MRIALFIMGFILLGFWVMLGWLAHEIDDVKKVMIIIWDELQEEDDE